MGKRNSWIVRWIILCLMAVGISLGHSFGSFAIQPASDEKMAGMASPEDKTTFEYFNENTGYCARIEDTANLLNPEQRSLLLDNMKAITAYGNVVFHSTDSNDTSTAFYAQQYYHSQFGNNSGTVFLIDMSNRMIYMFSDGAVYRILTKGKANTITDNVYTYATKGDYYVCAAMVFSQELTLLEGGRVSQSMKYASNGLLALVLALLINYYIARHCAGSQKPSDAEVLTGLKAKQYLLDFQVQHTHSNKVYSPVRSGGGRSGGTGGGGGGGGGHGF